ncbi:MAG TPA: PilZ domain-containing protein [Stellaceae bacterium]|nr:PilZ domain-containing protein [Stellaceae bacterium]
MDERSPQERRRHARAGVMLMASLRSATGIFDCMVLDISRGGAKLMLTEPHELSPAVTLVLQGFGSFRAQQVWRHGEVVGIRFVDAPDAIAGAFPGIVP